MSDDLDPEIRAMAAANRARWVAAFEEPTVARARAAYTERYRERSVPCREPVAHENLTIAGPGGPIPARLYRPSRPAHASLPLIVYFHGGGFVLGDADGYEHQSERLAAEMQCAVLFPEFRLAPEHPFPAAVHDAIAVVDWALQHTRDLGVASSLALAGDSAGGNLAANVCLSRTDGVVSRIAFQCLLYPWIDLRPYGGGGPKYDSIAVYSEGYLLDRKLMEWFTQQYLRDPAEATDSRASPILAELSGLPPTVVVTAGCDPLRDMGAAFARLLAAAGTSTDYVCMEGLAHNFMGHTASSSRARSAFDSVVRLVRRHMS